MVKIIQILIAPNDSSWQGMLLGLGNDGVTYREVDGVWVEFIPKLERLS